MSEYDVSLIRTAPSKDELIELLKDHGDKLRKLKSECTGVWQEDEEILDLVWKLLALKTFDPELGGVPPEHRLRWRLDANDQTSIRFQNRFKNRLYIPAPEVANAIQLHMKKAKIQAKHKDKGGFLKIELIEDHSTSEKKKPKTFRALTAQSMIRIPLQFPGPWLAKEGVIEFRVHWAGKPYHMTTPQVYKNHIPELIDSGVNLFSKDFAAPNYVNVVIKRAFAAGISQMVLISVDLKSSLHSIELSKKYVNSMFAVVGVHPVQALASPPTPEAEKELHDLIAKERKWIIAIGECGIDYEKVKEESLPQMKEAQEKWLQIQLKLASEFKLPIFIHQRGGHDQCLKLIREHLQSHPDLRIIVNCFSGTADELKAFMDLKAASLHVVITGLICSDDRGAHLREVVKTIPPESLLLATDAPHLTPYNMSRPYPRRNEPAFLPHTLVCVSECLNLPFEEVARKTTQNARVAFGMPTLLYDGTAPPARDIMLSEFQKDEDNRFKLVKKSKPKKLVITAEQTVFVVTNEEGKKVGFVVNPKESAIMQKQEKAKTPKELLELAAVMELQRVEANTQVTKGEEVVFSNVDD